MKHVIRNRVFETNSSNEHTLVLHRVNNTDVFWNKLKTEHPVIEIGTTPVSVFSDMSYGTICEISALDVIQKIDLLFYSHIGDTFENFFANMNQLIGFFGSKGIEIRFHYDLIANNIEEFLWFVHEEFASMLNDQITNVDEYEQFVVSDAFYHTCYEDDCGDEPESITELHERFASMPQDEVMSAYDRM